MIRAFGDPPYRMLNVAIVIAVVPLALSISLAALAFMADDWLFANCPNYRRRSG